MARNHRMSFDDACDLVDPDLPDGAFFAMAHEFAGLEYGEGFAELHDGLSDVYGSPKTRDVKCPQCSRRFENESDMQQHLRMMRQNGKHKAKGE